MSQNECIDLKSDIITARIDGMLCRAEEAGRKEGIEAGRKEGIEEGTLVIVKNMIDEGFSIEDIIRATGLSKDAILNAK